MKRHLHKISLALIAVVAITVLSLTVVSFSTGISTENQDRYRTFVKTNARCKKSNCSCSGYWGYKHGNGTYEGNCSNTDGHGHTCNHGPEQHGLKKW